MDSQLGQNLDNFLVHDRHDLQELQRLARSINWPAVTIAVRLSVPLPSTDGVYLAAFSLCCMYMLCHTMEVRQSGGLICRP